MLSDHVQEGTEYPLEQLAKGIGEPLETFSGELSHEQINKKGQTVCNNSEELKIFIKTP
jgi:hypothetical protein